MNDKKPCPLCGDDSEYSRFLTLCTKRANEIQRVNDLETLTKMYDSLGYVQVVRCKDCKFFGFFEDDNETAANEYCCYWGSLGVEPDGFCAWGEKRANERDIQR